VVTEVELSQLLSGAAGATAFVYAFLFLLRRGDSQQRDNISELRKQRDEQTARADRLAAELAKVDAELDRFRSEQQLLRHQLRSDVAGHRMVAELYRRRLVEAGLPTEIEEDE
jgi:uncharacterized protein YlxW (UPF0749 family)